MICRSNTGSGSKSSNSNVDRFIRIRIRNPDFCNSFRILLLEYPAWRISSMILSALMEARIRTTSSTPGLASFDTCSDHFVEEKP